MGSVISSPDNRCRVDINRGLTLVRGYQQKINRETSIHLRRSNMLNAGHFIIGRYMAKNMVTAITTDITHTTTTNYSSSLPLRAALSLLVLGVLNLALLSLALRLGKWLHTRAVRYSFLVMRILVHRFLVTIHSIYSTVCFSKFAFLSRSDWASLDWDLAVVSCCGIGFTYFCFCHSCVFVPSLCNWSVLTPLRFTRDLVVPCWGWCKSGTSSSSNKACGTDVGVPPGSLFALVTCAACIAGWNNIRRWLLEISNEVLGGRFVVLDFLLVSFCTDAPNWKQG